MVSYVNDTLILDHSDTEKITTNNRIPCKIGETSGGKVSEVCCDYCLTTSVCKTEKADFPSAFKGFWNVRRILTLLSEIRTMLENTALYQFAPENADR